MARVFKIHINYKGWAEERKRRFKKRLCKLLGHSEFRLLYVPPANEARKACQRPMPSKSHHTKDQQR